MNHFPKLLVDLERKVNIYGCVQTIRVPYTTDDAGRELIASLRRVQSAAIRSAYANALATDGSPTVEKDVRTLIKARFGTSVLDSWALQRRALGARQTQDPS